MMLHSAAAVEWALNRRQITPEAKLTLVALASFANERGFARPSIGDICEITGYPPKTVEGSISELIRDWVIRRKAEMDSTERCYEIPWRASP